MYEKDAISDIVMAISSVIIEQVWLLCLIFSALVKQWIWYWIMLGCDGMMKGFTENPALSSDS